MSRERSPNYPNASLPEALNRARKAFDKDRQAPLSRDVIARHIGYAGSSGAADKMVATLRQYGLLEKASSKGEFKVSQLAVDIFHPMDVQQKRHAIYLAAYTPEVFRQFRERFGPNVVPSDEAAKSFLVRLQYFNRAIDPIISAYTETCQFLEQEGAIESDGAAAPAVEESSEQPTTGGTWVESVISAKQAQVRNRIAHMSTTDQRVLTKGLLSKGATFEIIVSGQIGLKEMNMLIRKLELDKEILAEGATEGPDDE